LQGISKEYANQAKTSEVNYLYQFCTFRFDPENHLLESEGNPISLTPKAFEILLVLVQNGSRLTTKEELMRKPSLEERSISITTNFSQFRTKWPGRSFEDWKLRFPPPKPGD
jgi:DNA-binding response OmpR family regulator